MTDKPDAVAELVKRLRKDAEYAPNGWLLESFTKAAAALTTLSRRNAELEAALGQIEAEMRFPNQLEAGFVHGQPTLNDMKRRVEIAASIARAALGGTTDV